ncbi:hypothetical protein [Rhizobium sp. Leaf341]|uniref:hypothetical protein n=1 Tax=Rhizobium sp. Leaf341 TaxID=1736344 RepID=UPI00071539BC|nr:hypothetical protein [Rhizobium sp. Leaf341]KQR79286.1 hypothetical protein ASG03_12105 [Rhizobium sp. Leaf341]
MTHPVKAKPPTVELHVNLWRRIGRDDEDINYLDIGVRVIEQRDVGALNLYVPFKPDQCVFEDLAHLLRRNEIASAVFNELLEVQPTEDGAGTFFINQRGSHMLSVHEINRLCDIEFVTEFPDQAPPGFVIKILPSFCAKFQSPGEHYIRFRLSLKREAAEIFSSDVSNEDGWILSSTTTSEITEIRVNEVRSIPSSVLRLAEMHNWLSPQLSAIHYFLVRDISFDLIASHSSFRKIRRMEPVWDAYLGPNFPPGSARNMLIYHWRKVAEPGDLGDFVTLAKFRRSKTNLAFYIVLVIALGSLGSGLHATVSQVLKRATWEGTWVALLLLPSGWEVFVATVLLGLFAWWLAHIAKKRP